MALPAATAACLSGSCPAAAGSLIEVHACTPDCTLPCAGAGAGAELIEKAGAEVVEAACVIELPELQGRAKLDGLPLFVLVEKEGI